MIWTSKRIERLRLDAVQARSRVAALFRTSQIRGSDGIVLWGQFLDSTRDDTQHGVYGTSAGVQVLSHDGDWTAVERTAAFLARSIVQAGGDLERKGDTSIVFKLIYAAEAQFPLANGIEQEDAVLDYLAARQVPDQGWEDCLVAPANGPRFPTVLATSCALRALARYRRFRSTRSCEAAASWLSDRILHDRDRRPHELALAALCLLDLKGRGLSIEGMDAALAALTDTLSTWAGSAKADSYDLSETYHFSLDLDGRRANKYLFFLPHCIVPLALIRLRVHHRSARAYVLRATNYFVQELLSRRAFRPRTTLRVSSVDHLWISRLLAEFTSLSTGELQPYRLLRWAESPPLQRAILCILFSLVSVIAGLAASAATSSTGKLLWGIVATVALSLVGRCLWETLLKGQKK
ncbi:MAG: hypothetical protein M5U13_12530 [Thermoanaerobaculia bacterium]|nr:hypothetical protein [Thermoanaerobaculia bacterium]